MAKSRSRASSSRGASARSTSRKEAAPAAVEIVEEEPGMGINEGIILTTTIVLIVAWLFVDFHYGRYGGGMFFK